MPWVDKSLCVHEASHAFAEFALENQSTVNIINDGDAFRAEGAREIEDFNLTHQVAITIAGCVGERLSSQSDQWIVSSIKRDWRSVMTPTGRLDTKLIELLSEVSPLPWAAVAHCIERILPGLRDYLDHCDIETLRLTMQKLPEGYGVPLHFHVEEHSQQITPNPVAV